MAEQRPPLLSLSLLKAATRTGSRSDKSTTTAITNISARGPRAPPSASSMPTLFDARRELAADLQRREARRAQARAEAADTEGETSVLAALRAVHRLLGEAGELESRERERRVFSIRSRTCRGKQSALGSAARALLEGFFQQLRRTVSERHHDSCLWDHLS